MGGEASASWMPGQLDVADAILEADEVGAALARSGTALIRKQ